MSKEKVEPSERQDVPYLSLEHIEPESGLIIGRGTGADVCSTKAVFWAGDVLYGKLRPYLNKVCIPDFDGICSTDILVFPQSAHLESQYLLRFLMQRSVVEYAHHHSAGVQLPRVSFAKLAEVEFPLPPLPEQRRIVAAVEALLARVQAARARLAKVPALLKRFRQSVLAAACSGQLTADWRDVNETNPSRERWNASAPPLADPELPDLPKNWTWWRLDGISERVSVGHVGPTSAFYCSREVGIPFVRSQNVRPMRLVLEDVQFITPSFHESLRKSQLQPGDLLVVRVGANRGDTCIVPHGIGALNCANIVFARPFPGVSAYLHYYCQSKVGQDRLLGMTTGSAQGVLNTKSVAELPVPIPPETEQQEVLRRVGALFALADKIEVRVTAATLRVEKITQAILAKAFRGELVPTEAELARAEGRDYEPASVLLERIRAERGGGSDESGSKSRRVSRSESNKTKGSQR